MCVCVCVIHCKREWELLDACMLIYRSFYNLIVVGADILHAYINTHTHTRTLFRPYMWWWWWIECWKSIQKKAWNVSCGYFRNVYYMNSLFFSAVELPITKHLVICISVVKLVWYLCVCSIFILNAWILEKRHRIYNTHWHTYGHTTGYKERLMYRTIRE